VPVVKAPDTPNKVVPPPQTDQSGKQIYDRVTDKGGNEKIGTTPEEPVDVKGGTQRNSITGLIQGVPPGGSVAQPPPAPPATQQASVPPPEPKKVKTVPIRPDQPTGTTAPPRAATTAPAPAPMRLGANQTQTPPARNTAVAGGFVVQVASQLNEADAQASYRALQTKYSTVLGDRQAFIRKADFGEKGVRYRALLGPFTTLEQANELCTSLKAAGGQCFAMKN
jgi:SPOR domain